MTKSIIFAGTFSTTTTGAQTFTVATDASGQNILGEGRTSCSSMDVLLNVKTLSGTSPTTTPSIQETFSGVGFIETANWGATPISATGKYFLAHDGQTGQTGASKIAYGFAMLGKGIDKQIVFTNGGTIGSIAVDVYFIFYDGQK